MNENEWVQQIAPDIEASLRQVDARLSVRTRCKLPYANEVRSYRDDAASDSLLVRYETDLLITEQLDDSEWKPRVIVEAKCRGVTTHDAITYSHKALSHRQVHPFLRYGILIGERKHLPLPGSLIRHGTQFDFMLSWSGMAPTSSEMEAFVDILLKEVVASRSLEDMVFNSRLRDRQHYTVLHKDLILKSSSPKSASRGHSDSQE